MHVHILALLTRWPQLTRAPSSGRAAPVSGCVNVGPPCLGGWAGLPGTVQPSVSPSPRPPTVSPCGIGRLHPLGGAVIPTLKCCSQSHLPTGRIPMGPSALVNVYPPLVFAKECGDTVSSLPSGREGCVLFILWHLLHCSCLTPREFLFFAVALASRKKHRSPPPYRMASSQRAVPLSCGPVPPLNADNGPPTRPLPHRPSRFR
jgi:hypothetical protein